MIRRFRTMLTAALAAVSFSAFAGVIGGPADDMGPMVSDHGPLVNQALNPPPMQGGTYSGSRPQRSSQRRAASVRFESPATRHG